MDGGINDLLSTFLSNPDMMKKAMNILSLMSAGETKEQTASENNAAVPVMAQVTQDAPLQDINAAPKTDAPETSASPMANMSSDQLATMVSSVISALGMNGNAQPAESVHSPAPQVDTQPNTPPPVAEAPSVQQNDTSQNAAPASANFDIEKALGVLKNVSKETSPQKDNRVQLLLSLKPFLKDGRKQKIDMAVKYLNAAKVFNMFGKNGFI